MPGLVLTQDFGQLTGNFGYDLARKAITFDLNSTLDISEVMKILYPGDKNWFRNVKYTKPPLLRLMGQWFIQDPNGLQAQGDFDWEDWIANKVTIRSAKSQLFIDGRKFRFKNIHLERNEGFIKGDFSLDFNSQSALLDATSTIDFSELTRLVGSKTEELFRPYRFLTPPRIQWKGILSFGEDSLNDLSTHVECDRFQTWKLSASHVSADIRSFRKSLEIARYSSEFYSGRLDGDAVFDFSKPIQDWAFHCRIQKVDFDHFTHDLWDYREVQGNLTGWAEMSGTTDSSRELRGNGEVKVADGILWKIPLFGELSKFIPILGVQKATKAYAAFYVDDEKVHVDDMKISAGIMSLTAKGIYQFDQSLDFIVQVHFLRGLFGVGYLLDPFTKAFEYHLGGKLQARKWKPRFLPKELLLQFGDEDSPERGNNLTDDSTKP